MNRESVAIVDNDGIDLDDIDEENWGKRAKAYSDHRNRQLDVLRDAGIEIYPHTYDAKMTIEDFRSSFEHLKVGDG